MATFSEVTDPYISSFRRVPAAGPGVCQVCHWASGDFPSCWSCRESGGQVSAPCRLVVPVSLCERWGPLHNVLREYKDSRVAAVRNRFRPHVAGLLGRFLALHSRCITYEAGDEWEVVTTVPSGHGRDGQHPFEEVVGLIVPQRDQLERLLEPGPSPLEHNQANDDAFRVTRDVAGTRVLLLDDTYTSGAAVQSAASALQIAGAQVVAAVPVGRYVKPDFNEHTEAMWDMVSSASFSFDTCCLE